MAEYNSTQDAGGQEIYPVQNGAPIGAALNVIGAAASLALIVGIGVWGYKLVMRDVSGVPVVSALKGPMRIQPADPGGQPADHQGLAVNAVAAKGTAEEPAHRVVLAPRPVDLTAEDQPVETGTPLAASVVPQARAKPKTPAGPDQAAADPAKVSSVQSLVDQLVAKVMPAQDEQPDTTVVKASAKITQPVPLAPEQEAAVVQPDSEPEAEAAQIAPAVVKGPGIAKSLRPRVRPVRADLPVETAAAKPALATLDVDPDSLTVGTRLAQLGAFESPEVAKQEWDRLSGRFGDYMAGKSRVIQKTSSGGRTFYRLRALGFQDLSDARRFCSVLMAERADCIPVTTR